MGRACGMYWGRGQAYNVLVKKNYRTETTLKTYTQMGYCNKFRPGNAPIT
jgi:hypothetical protein